MSNRVDMEAAVQAAVQQQHIFIAAPPWLTIAQRLSPVKKIKTGGAAGDELLIKWSKPGHCRRVAALSDTDPMLLGLPQNE